VNEGVENIVSSYWIFLYCIVEIHGLHSWCTGVHGLTASTVYDVCLLYCSMGGTLAWSLEGVLSDHFYFFSFPAISVQSLFQSEALVHESMSKK
jgi:hypothetical protein